MTASNENLTPSHACPIARFIAALEAASAALDASSARKRQALAEAAQACDEYLMAARAQRGKEASNG